MTNRRKGFFLQSQGPQQFTAYIDKLRNMAVEAHLANATAEDLIGAQQTTSGGGARPKQPKKQEDPARRKEIERLMKGKCYPCGENHQTDQCSQKGSSLKCTSCGRKGHVAKAWYTDMLKKSGAIKTNTVQASPGQLAITQEQTTLPTRMIRENHRSQHCFQCRTQPSYGPSSWSCRSRRKNS